MSVGDDDNDNDLIKKHLLYLLYNHVFRQEFKKKKEKKFASSKLYQCVLGRLN